MDFEKRILENKNQEGTEKQGINYDDLIAAYYYDALSFQNIFYEKHFEKAVERLRDALLIYCEDYLKRDVDIDFKGRMDRSLHAYIEDFSNLLRQENEPKKIFLEINSFIMIVHEQIRSMLGEKALGFSANEFKALNYIDINKPLNEQKK